MRPAQTNKLAALVHYMHYGSGDHFVAGRATGAGHSASHASCMPIHGKWLDHIYIAMHGS